MSEIVLSCQACMRPLPITGLRSHRHVVDGDELPSSRIRLCEACSGNFLLAIGEALGNLVRTRGRTARSRVQS